MGEECQSPAELRAEIARLRARVAELETARGDPSPPDDRLTTVRVPDAIAPTFLRAQQSVSRYFASFVRDPERSTIAISGERYVLVRAASLSVEFSDLLASLHGEQDRGEGRRVARQLLFDVAHAIGKADAKALQASLGAVDPIERLSTGPVHFSFSGWAFVDILPESLPRPDDDYYLIYDHPFSFESDAWLKQGRSADSPVCVMNAGYSSGWCTESFGMPLVAAEIECRACGDARCRFIMAPPARIAEHIERYRATKATAAPSPGGGSGSVVAAHGFLERERVHAELRAALQAQSQKNREVEEALAASEATQREIFEAANDGMAIIDLEGGGVIDANQRLCEMFHASRESLLRGAVGLVGVATVEEAEVLRDYMRRAAERGPQLFEWLCRDGAGNMLCVEVNLKRGCIGRRDRLLAIVRDVTDRKAAEAEIERARDLALESGRLKSEFLANMSHEIRTPLHVIFGMNDLLREETSLTSDQRELVESVHRNAANLIQIVDDILDLSRIEAGKLELHTSPCAVGSVLRDAVDVYTQPARAKALELRAEVPKDLPIGLVGDAGRLRQILLNLIGNAVKFTEAGFIEVAVEVAHAAPERLTLRFRISDTGIGIPHDQRHRLFRSFSQVDGSMTRQFGGIGLGLAISRQLVELMGGEIGVVSEVGRGSTFWFTVPMDLAPVVVPRIPRRVAAR